jgi:hypothetical protein
MMNEFTISIGCCARCDKKHENLAAKPFTRPIKDDAGQPLATHFAMCPTTGEPILLLSIQTAK